jgi:pyruvate/2-oxoglutarate dehydrogenase complex dihydrolipoamide acyltransferase (E2) component
MAIEIKLPPAEGVESADIAEVYVNEGDVIAKDQAICQIETGKATLDVPSPQAGKIVKIHIKPGQSVPVGGVLLSLEATAGAASAPPATKPAPAAPPPAAKPTAPPVAAAPVASVVASPPPAVAAAPVAQPVVATAPAPNMLSESNPNDATIPAGPAVRRFAREVGVDLRNVTGTGEGGRITRDDVLRVVREHSQGSVATVTSGQKTSKKPSTGVSDQWGPVHIEKMTKIRKMIAQQMHKSWTSVPRVTNFDDADVTELEKLRISSKDDYAKKGIKLTSLPFVIKAVAMALRDHPAINASIDMEQEQIIYKQYVSIGIAVDSDRGLVVPSLRNADEMSIPDIARAMAQLAENVRNNAYSIADLQGSTFTISNLGAIGGTYSTPIINIPEVAILLLGRSRQMPVVQDGEIKIRLLMPLSLSYDHRLVDGATAARFLNDVIGYLKNPSRLLLAP